MEPNEWLILNYTLPKEPSRVRVSVWRKLKKCGSVILGQSMWVLPATDHHSSLFHEIAEEIIQNEGNAFIFQGTFLQENMEETLLDLFNKARNDEYQELLEKCEDYFREILKETEKQNFSFAEIEENEEEYRKLITWYRKIAKRDFFHSSLKSRAEEELAKCSTLLADFSNRVYELNDENEWKGGI